MIATDDILTVALCFTDRALTEGEKQALTTLCEEANRLWEGRLREGVDPANFPGIYALACAYTALGNLTDALKAGAAPVGRFAIGDFSASLESRATACERSLQAQAEALMIPYTSEAPCFAFLGVAG